MRILFITDAVKPNISGVSQLKDDIEQFVPQHTGHEIASLTPHDFTLNTPIPGQKGLKFALPMPFSISRAIKNIKPDAITIATELGVGKTAAAYCRRENIPYTSTYCTHWDEWASANIHPTIAPIANWWSLPVHKGAQKILVASSKLADEIAARGITTPTAIIGRPIDLDVMTPAFKHDFDEAAAKELAGLPRPLGVFVGRVSQEKGVDDLFALKTKGAIAAYGPGHDVYENTDTVKFMGPVHDRKKLAALFRQADYCIFPSKPRFETFGRTPFEAAACGLPVVARPHVGAIDDLVTNAKYGALNNNLQKAYAVVAAGLAAYNDDKTRWARHEQAQRLCAPDNFARKFVEAQVPLHETA